MITRRLAVLAAAGLLLAGCAQGGGIATDEAMAPVSSPASAGAGTEQEVRRVAEAVLDSLAAQDYEALAELVHPVEGVRFVPYGYIDVDNSIALMPEHVAELGSDDKTYIWGEDPGTGEPLKMDFAEYNERFLYDQQFLQADKVAVDSPLGEGSSLDNTAEVFPGAQYVDFHFDGFDEEYAGLDWETLRVVLSQRDGRWYLVGLIHNSWTP